MLDKGIRVLNFDDSIIRQRKLLAQYPCGIINLTELAASARLYMPAALREKISGFLKPQGKKYPVLLGSGDFHHISEILTGQINEPASLIVFDFHPDWDILSPRFGCGSWVRQALKNKNISKCVLIGMGSSDLSALALQTANLGALANSRLEIYPYRHKPSRVFCRKVPDNYSIDVDRELFSSKITWHQLESLDLEEFTLKLIKRLPVPKAYISIDKDCLKNDFALTNWEEGFLRLDQLLTMIRLLLQHLDIIGLDITGDYSDFPAKGKIKALISKFDHPKELSAHKYHTDVITAVNEQTNLKILGEIFA